MSPIARTFPVSGFRFPAFLAFATLVFGGEPPAPPPPTFPSIEPRRAAFDYDRRAGFALEEKGREDRGAAVVRDITFLAAPGKADSRVAAYVVAPRDGVPKAAILWVHWLGEPATTNRTEFLDEAVALAARGVVSILPDCQWAKPEWYRNRMLDDDYENGVAQVIALRRALDLLVAQPGAASVPLGLVGHDYGGMYGTIAAPLDSRLKTCVLIACTASFNDWAFFVQQPAAKDAYFAENAALELRDYLSAIKGASLFFQFAESDRYVPLTRAQDFFGAAPSPKQMTVYGGATHAMTAPARIRIDRTMWLVRELGLTP